MPSKKASDAEILRGADQYLVRTYRRPPIVFTRGKGCRLYDTSGRAYLDFLGGIAVNALGYSHPRLVRVMRREAAKAVHFSNLFHNPFQGPLAKKLAEWSGLDRVFFTNSGTEAMEGAMKLARAVLEEEPGGGRAGEDAVPGAGKFVSRTHVWGRVHNVPCKISRAI